MTAAAVRGAGPQDAAAEDAELQLQVGGSMFDRRAILPVRAANAGWPIVRTPA
jgi:hypothetical protein